MYKIFAVSLVLSALLSACAAVQVAPEVMQVAPQVAPEAVALGTGTTIQGIRATLAQQPGTFIMQQNELFLLAWPKGQTYAYLMVGKGNIDLNSIKANTFDFSKMIRFLEGGGWKYVPASALPAKVVKVLGSYSIEQVVAGAASMTSFYVLPVFLFDDGLLGEYGIRYSEEMIQ